MRFLLILLLALLAGCTSVTDLKDDFTERFMGREPAHAPSELKEDFKPSVELKVLWQANVGASTDFDFVPAVYDNAVFAASQTGDLYKLDSVTGKPLWHVVAGENISGGVGAGEGLVLVGTSKGMVLAFDEKTGKALWQSKIASEILSPPKVFKDVVVVRSGDSRIYGLNAADGKRKWVYERVTPALTLRSSAGVTVDGEGAVFAGFSGGKLVALNSADGRVYWEATVTLPKGATEIERIADITSLPVVEGRYVYAVAYQGSVVSIERASGKVLWNHELSSYNGLAVDGAVIYVTQGNDAMYSLDYASGRSYWRQGDLLYRQLSAPVVLDRSALVGDLEGWVHLLARDDGAIVGRIKTDGTAIMPQPVELASGIALVQTRGGGLFAIAIK
ncbi:MAG TPA: outer membrane protein assembly factor BamB [Methylophilaceae bacterium]